MCSERRIQAKRRIPLIEALRASSNAPILIYVLMPSEKNMCENRSNFFKEAWKEIGNSMEFPNITEGYSHIYKVVNGDITEVSEPADENIGNVRYTCYGILYNRRLPWRFQKNTVILQISQNK